METYKLVAEIETEKGAYKFERFENPKEIIRRKVSYFYNKGLTNKFYKTEAEFQKEIRKYKAVEKRKFSKMLIVKEKIKEIVLEEKLKEDNYLITKDDNNKIWDLTNIAYHWDSFNFELYNKIYKTRNNDI